MHGIVSFGLGIFTGPSPVLYIPVARTPLLAALHEALWTALEEVSQGSSAYYAPAAWFPQITLGHGDIAPENLGSIVQWLSQEPLTWTIKVDNFSFIDATTKPHVLRGRFDLRYDNITALHD